MNKSDFKQATKTLAAEARRTFGDGDRQSRRLDAQHKEQKMSKDERDQALAVYEHGKAVLSANDPYEKYKEAVWAAYAGNKELSTYQLKALAVISHNYGLNPNPGLDLVYAWIDKNTGKFIVHVSYKGWLALAKQYKKFVQRYRTLSADEVVARGGNPGDIVVECRAIPLDDIEHLKMLVDVGLEINPSDYEVVGVGVFKKGDNIPKGRDAEWVAKKRATKDFAVQLMIGEIAISSPKIDGAYYDTDADAWVVEGEGIEEESSMPEPFTEDGLPDLPEKTEVVKFFADAVTAFTSKAGKKTYRVEAKDGSETAVSMYRQPFRLAFEKEPSFASVNPDDWKPNPDGSPKIYTLPGIIQITANEKGYIVDVNVSDVPF